MNRSNNTGDLSMNDARAIIERQKSQINSQHLLINQKEQEIQHLRVIKQNDLSMDDEVKLQQLRGLRGQTEKLRLNNEVILNEITTIKGHLSNRSTDLASYLRNYHQLDDQIKLALSWREWLDECLKLIVATCNNNASIQEKKRLSNLSQEAYSKPSLQLPTQELWKTWNESLRNLKQTDDRIASKSNSINSLSPQPSKTDVFKFPTSSTFNKPLPNISRNDTQILRSSQNQANDLTGITKISKNEIQPTAVSSLFTRATNSPPSARRASLMLLLNSAASTPSVTPTGEPNKVFQVSGSKGLISRQKCPEATIFALGRAKTPPRYASRTVINDTYMRRLLDKENIEKYKKTANEIYMNQVAKISTKYLDNQKVEVKSTSATKPSEKIEECSKSKIDVPKDNDFDQVDDHLRNSNASSSDSSLDMVGLSERDAIEVDLDKVKNDQINCDTELRDKTISNSNINNDKTTTNTTTITMTMNSTNNSADSAVIADMSNSSSVNSPCPGTNVNTSTNSNGYISLQKGPDVGNNNLMLHDLKIQAASIDNDQRQSNVSIVQPDANLTDETDFQQLPPINLMDHHNLEINNSNLPSSDESANHIEIYVPPNDNDKVKSILKRLNLKKDLTEAERLVHQQKVLTGEEEAGKNVRFHPLALLLDAALEGDIELVKRASNQVDDVSLPNDEGITALHNAVCAGRIEIAKFLVLEAGADVNAGDTDGWTPLHCAASCANLKLARLLVENGAVLNARTLSDYETPLEKCDNGACEDGDCEDYLYMEHERLFSSKNHTVYAVFDRIRPSCLPTSNTSSTLVCLNPKENDSSPDSKESELEEKFLPDELDIKVNDELLVLDPNPPDDIEWMLVRNVLDGKEGLVPKNFISCYRVKRKIIMEDRQKDQKANNPIFKPEISDLLIDSSVDDVANAGKEDFSSQSSTFQNTVQYPQSESPPLIPFSSRVQGKNDIDTSKKTITDPIVIQTAM